MADKDTERQYPPRGDGGTWKPHMHVVARERALGAGWPEAADVAGLTHGTVRNYPGRYSGWDDLVDYYRRKAFDERLNDHWTEGSLEALDALRHEFREAHEQLRQLERKAEDGELEAEEAKEALGLSRAVVYAASQYLDATGRKKYQQTIAKLRAQEEVTGEPGDRVNLKHALEEKEEMDADELSQAYRHVVGATEE